MERWYALDTEPVKTVPDDNASWIGGTAVSLLWKSKPCSMG